MRQFYSASQSSADRPVSPVQGVNCLVLAPALTRMSVGCPVSQSISAVLEVTEGIAPSARYTYDRTDMQHEEAQGVSSMKSGLQPLPEQSHILLDSMTAHGDNAVLLLDRAERDASQSWTGLCHRVCKAEPILPRRVGAFEGELAGKVRVCARIRF